MGSFTIERMMAFLGETGKGIQRVLGAFVGQSCPVCLAVTQAETPRLCLKCFGELKTWDKVFPPRPTLPDHIDGFFAPLLYEEGAKRLIHQYKYSDKRMLAEALLPFLMRELATIDEEIESVMAVPMHRKRHWWRQFNQSYLLAEGLAARAGLAHESDFLERSRSTRPQRGLSAKHRKSNLKGAFNVLEDMTGKSVLLIDDVWTTGSTMEECAKVLKKAGAKNVYALTICFVEP